MVLQQFRTHLNVRDLGGYPTTNNTIINEHTFYRTGGLYLLNEEEQQSFQQLNIQCIVDLRSKLEVNAHPDPTFENIPYFQYSGLVSKGGEDIDFSPKGMFQTGLQGQKQLEDLTKYYKQMPFGNDAFHIIIDQIKNHNTPIVFHCASGKDRTGVMAMILLLLLGVDEETVLEDYMLSNVYRKSYLDATYEKHKEEINQDPILKKLLQMQDGVSLDIGKAVLLSIKDTYTTYDNYFLQEYGLTKDDIFSLRQTYTH